MDHRIELQMKGIIDDLMSVHSSNVTEDSSDNCSDRGHYGHYGLEMSIPGTLWTSWTVCIVSIKSNHKHSYGSTLLFLCASLCLLILYTSASGHNADFLTSAVWFLCYSSLVYEGYVF